MAYLSYEELRCDKKGLQMAEQLITVVETREFERRAATRMSEQERQDFITFIAGRPDDGAYYAQYGWGPQKPLGQRLAGQARRCPSDLLLP